MTTAKISTCMTLCPHTIGAKQNLAAAHRFMRENDIRHLPVLDEGQLVGIVSQRDLYFIESLEGVDPNEVTVEEAMTPEPFSVDPDASVEHVVREMAANKYGAAVVTDGGHVTGMFTTTDALRLLVAQLAAKRRHPPKAARKTR